MVFKYDISFDVLEDKYNILETLSWCALLAGKSKNRNGIKPGDRTVS